MKETTPVSKLKHRDLLYEAMVLVMSKIEVTVGGDRRFLDLYGELSDRLESGFEVCSDCGTKRPASEMVEK